MTISKAKFQKAIAQQKAWVSTQPKVSKKVTKAKIPKLPKIVKAKPILQIEPTPTWHHHVPTFGQWGIGQVMQGAAATSTISMTYQVSTAVGTAPCSEVFEPAPKKPLLSNLPRTQKAKGILCGKMLLSSQFMWGIGMAEHALVKSEKGFTDCGMFSTQNATGRLVYNGGIDLFARPCPVRPRHGFVESRKVTTKKQVLELLAEVIKEDPEGELLISNYIESSHSAVLTEDGTLSIGIGHDGATGGHGSYMFSVLPLKMPAFFKQVCGVDKNDSCYFEFVMRKDSSQITATQVRGGPSVPPTVDFIPEDMTVMTIELPTDDLLLWEKKVKSFLPGTVVYGNGHTLASHAAVHCICNKIPFITSHQPCVGEILKPKEGQELFAYNEDEFYSGFNRKIDTSSTGSGVACRAAIAILHNWATISVTPIANKALGFASMALWRMSIAAIIGELRHAFISTQVEARHVVYEEVLQNPAVFVGALEKASRIYASGRWKSGFGGLNWAKCANGVVSYNESICDFIEGKSTTADLISALNRLINLAHNNGSLLNKYMENDLLNVAAKTPAVAAVHGMVGLYELAHNKVEMKAVEAVRTTLSQDFWIVDTGYDKVCRSSRQGIDYVHSPDIPPAILDMKDRFMPNMSYVVELDGTVFSLEKKDK